MDESSLSFFMQCGVPPWRELVKTRGIVGTPLLEIATRFVTAATYAETLDIETHVEEWRAKVFVQRHRVRRGDDADLRRHRDARLREARRRRSRSPARHADSRRHSGAVQLSCTSAPFPITTTRRHLHEEHSPASLAALAVAFGAVGAAQADVTIGVSLPLTGPTSALGIPCKNGILLWPSTVAGEKLNVIILDDATDPTKA